MKILAVSNLFPPAALGGYELGASWVCRELVRRGHDVAVCSASRRLWAHTGHYDDVACPWPEDLPWIDAGTAIFGFDLPRLLAGGYAPAFDGARLAVHEALIAAPGTRSTLRAAAMDLAPEVVLLFNPAGLLISPVHDVLDAVPARIPVVAYVSDDWPTRWPAAHPLAALAGSGAATPPAEVQPLVGLLSEAGLLDAVQAIPIDHAMFCSEFLRARVGSATGPDARTSVAHWGLPDLRTRAGMSESTSGRRGAGMARREEGAYREYVSDEQRRRTGVPAARGVRGGVEVGCIGGQSGALIPARVLTTAYPPVPVSGFRGDAPLTLAFCGQILHHKGLAHVIRALPLTRRPHVLVVIGDHTSDYGVMCQRLVRSSDLTARVVFTGKLSAPEAIKRLHADAQVLVVPSLKLEGHFEEPFSIVVLQGMALGQVVVSSATGGTPEAVTDGVTGRLCDVTDPARLAAVIDAIEQDRPRAEALGRAARERVEREFSIEIMTDRVETTLEAQRQPAGAGARRLAITTAVTYASQDPANTGCVRVTRQLARTLAERTDVTLHMATWDEAGRRLRALTVDEAQVLSHFNGPPARISTVRPALPRGSWLLLPEVVTEAEASAMRLQARREGLHVAAVFYDAIPLTHQHLCAPDIRTRHAAYMRGLGRCDRVLAISETAAADLATFWQSEGIAGPPVDVVPLAGGMDASPKEVAPLDEGAGVKQILCVSTLEPRKGHVRLLAAVEALTARQPALQWSLVLVGNRYEGSESLVTDVEAVCAADSRITWRGVVSDEELHALYASSWCTVYPSEVEGFGLPVAESLAQGRPCICDGTGAVGELARAGGCVTVDVRNVDALAGGLERLLTDAALHAQLSAEAAARPVRTWNEYARDVADALRPLPNVLQLPARLTDTLYAGLHAEHWQMTHAERLTFIKVLEDLRPGCAIEVGTYQGGSLSVLARTCGVVFSVDIDPTVAHRFADYDNVRFLTGSSQALLPVLLAELQRAGMDPEFALIDGSHATDDVRADMVPFLDIVPRRPLTILVHDSAHPPCRLALNTVPWDRSPYVAAVELDFVPGSAQTALTKPLDQLYGGLGLIRLDPAPRTGPITITSGAMRL